MEAGRVIALARSEFLRDTAEPYLFSDDALLTYLNEGLNTIARKTFLFTQDVTVQTTAGSESVELPINTIAVLNVRHVDTGERLLLVNRKFNLQQLPQARPRAYKCGRQCKKIHLFPTPDKQYELGGEVAYLPPTLGMSDDVPMDDDYALLLVQFITHRALRTNDPDGSAMIESDRFQTAWLEGLRDIKREVIRNMAGDTPYAQPRRWT